MPLITAPPLSGGILGSLDDTFVIVEWQDQGGEPEPPRLIAPLHVHHQDDEAWYVLDGTLRVQVGNDVVEARAGSGVFVPRGTPHTYWNAASGPLRYLLVMTANISRLIEEIHTLPERNVTTVKAVFEKYNSELLDG